MEIGSNRSCRLAQTLCTWRRSHQISKHSCRPAWGKGANTEPHSRPPPRLKTARGRSARGGQTGPASSLRRAELRPSGEPVASNVLVPRREKDWGWLEMEEAKKQNRPPRLEPPKAPPAPSLFSRSRRRAEHKSYRTSHFWRGRLGTKSKQTRHLGDLALHLADRLVVLEACGLLRARAERCSLWRGAASRDYKAAKPLLDWPQTKKRESEWEDSIFFGSSKKKKKSLLKLHLLTVVVEVGRRSWVLLLAVQHHHWHIHYP